MKKTISTTVLIMTVLFIFSNVSHAQYNNNFGSHGAMASLAEKERISKAQNATTKKNDDIATNSNVAYAGKVYPNVSEEKDQVEK